MKTLLAVFTASIMATGFATATAGEPVAARNIRVGTVLAASDFQSPDGEEALRLAAAYVGLEASRAIYSGQPIMQSDLRAPTIMTRNAIVTMEFKRGPLMISTEGRALDQGGMGERIRVMNLLSRRTVSATIISANTVRTQ